MADIITADNLPLVVGAVLSGLAGLAVWKQGGKLGEQARMERPPPPATVIAGGLVMSNVGSADMIGALQDIAAAVREATDEARDYRESKTTTILARMQEQLDAIAAHEKAPPPRR